MRKNDGSWLQTRRMDESDIARKKMKHAIMMAKNAPGRAVARPGHHPGVGAVAANASDLSETSLEINLW